ncbi:MAG TPA: pyridoxal phosphate-dependent aminotransferase [Candidatus Eisenbacteria bacterium]|jgi:aspartate/methionine/tyrosine aminotransferase
MLSRRLPSERTPNPWARALAARRAADAPLLDLTESNPTRVGLGGAGEVELASLADPRAARYEPDPRGLASARRAIADYYRSRGQSIDPEHIVLTSGTSEAYAHLFRLLADPGDAFLVSAPSYPLFEPLAALEGVRIEPYRLVYDGRWHLDLGSVEAALAGDSRVRAIIVVQPNHPTGSCLDADEVEAFESVCERHDLALISDEVFGDFNWSSDDRPLPSLLGERRVPAFVLGGLSKSCGMPQLKLSWIVAAGPNAARERALQGLEWIADLFLSVSTPVQLALPQLLEAGHDFRRRMRERLSANQRLLRELAVRRPAIDVLSGEGGWASVLRLPVLRTGEEWALALLERGVVVHPGHFYDIDGEAYVVVSLIPESEPFARALAQIEASLAEA